MTRRDPPAFDGDDDEAILRSLAEAIDPLDLPAHSRLAVWRRLLERLAEEAGPDLPGLDPGHTQ